MSLDVALSLDNNEVFSANITHNLGKMASEAGIYKQVWRPEETSIQHAKDLIPHLEKGIETLKAYPEHFIRLDAHNGWGKYKHFVPWLEEYLAACKNNPEADVNTWR